MPADDIIEFIPTTLTYGGDALGRLSSPSGEAGSRAIFVPFALPGETVQARIVEEKKNFVRAELVEVLEPSPQRIRPRCKHFTACGGCHYQHMSYAAQLAAKEEILRDQLIRIGKIESPPVKPIIPSPAEWNYRNHIQFHLSDEGKLGFTGTRGRNSPDHRMSPARTGYQCPVAANGI